MSRTTVLVVAWIGATIVSILIASAAVGAVRGNVSDAPQPLSSATTIAPTTPQTTTAPSSTATTEPPPTAVTLAPETSTTTPGTTATSIPDPVVTSTTAPPVTAPASGEIETYAVTGGTVSIEVFSDHLSLLGAVPAAGFSVSEKEISAKKIEIEFKSSTHESKFVATLEDGVLKIETEPHEED
jgi:hypothetical protein